ncbi:asialoglycoprotein receptor 1 [Elysia marginata]|uniref:Asialoglycoprotein receptor 1 n=1 Tax=Elysia marginata TaxID=1093978 RepID=A0AAV4J866_9GAST|nr:asialoglycoprotein receptor 1 [Elysia marginata]
MEDLHSGDKKRSSRSCAVRRPYKRAAIVSDSSSSNCSSSSSSSSSIVVVVVVVEAAAVAAEAAAVVVVVVAAAEAAETAALASTWTAKSKTLCIAECVKRFQDRCTNVVFNTDTLDCTPVRPDKSRDSPAPTSLPGDVLYSRAAERDLSCDVAKGFRLYEHCGTAACVFNYASSRSYSFARSYCSSLNAVVFVPNSHERFALLEFIASQLGFSNTWVGLIRADSNSPWSWENGKVADPNFLSPLWGIRQPDEYPADLCAKSTQSDKLHDVPCTWGYRFLCEQIY